MTGLAQRLEEPSSPPNNPLATLVKSLQQTVADCEENFMALGLSLQKIQQTSSSQRSQIASLMHLFQADDNSGLMQDTSLYVRQCLEDTRSAQNSASNLCTELAAMIQVLKEIDTCTEALQRSGLLLNVIGINTSVECSRYEQMEATFNVVAKETTALAEQIRQATDLLSHKSVQAQQQQNKNLLDAKKNRETFGNLAGNTEKTTEIALAKVAELIDSSMTLVRNADEAASQISQQLAQLVMGIQFHDNLRQRVEHINEALREQTDSEQESDEEKEARHYLAAKLQTAQLDSLAGELDDLYQTQSQALENITMAIHRLCDELSGMIDSQNDREKQHPIAALISGMNVLRELNRESETLSDEIHQRGNQTQEIVAEMNKAITATSSIANDVKINALNAIIKAARFGHAGEALQVLAQGMVEVSKETRGQIETFLEHVSSMLTLSERDTSALSNHPSVEKENDFNSGRLQDTFETYQKSLRDCLENWLALADSLKQEQGNLSFISLLKDKIKSYSREIDAYAKTINPDNDDLLARVSCNFGARVESLYTMNKERLIHQSLGLSGSGTDPGHFSPSDQDVLFETHSEDPAGPDPVPRNHSSLSEKDLKTSRPWEAGASQDPTTDMAIELWDEEAGDNVGHAVEGGEQSEPDSGAGQDLNKEAGTSPEIPLPNERKDQDFGENVELF